MDSPNGLIRVQLSDEEYNILQEVVGSQEVLDALNLREPINTEQLDKLILLLSRVKVDMNAIRGSRQRMSEALTAYNKGTEEENQHV